MVVSRHRGAAGRPSDANGFAAIINGWWQFVVVLKTTACFAAVRSEKPRATLFVSGHTQYYIFKAAGPTPRKTIEQIWNSDAFGAVPGMGRGRGPRPTPSTSIVKHKASCTFGVVLGMGSGPRAPTHAEQTYCRERALLMQIAWRPHGAQSKNNSTRACA